MTEIPQVVRLRSLRVAVGNRARAARNLVSFLEGDNFSRAWAIATEQQRLVIEQHCLELDKTRVESLCRVVLSANNLADKSLKDLREMAKVAGIEYYHHKSKDELLEELRVK